MALADTVDGVLTKNLPNALDTRKNASPEINQLPRAIMTDFNAALSEADHTARRQRGPFPDLDLCGVSGNRPSWSDSQ